MWLVTNHYSAVSIYRGDFCLTRERHPIARPLGRAMGCCSWVQIRFIIVIIACVHYRIIYNRDISRVYYPACRTSLIATRFWVVVICPIIKCLTVLEFSFILFDLCLFITIFNFILNYVSIVTFWIFTYHKIWILLIIFCFIWNYWIIFFNMFGSVLECCELTGVSLLWPWLIKWKIGLAF